MSEYEFWKDIGNISEAIKTYQRKNAEFNNRYITPWIGLGNLGGQDEHNISAYKHATDIDPNNARNWISLGDAQLKACIYSEAATAYRKAVELDPYAGSPLSNLALALVMQNKFDEAIPLYIASIELFTEDKDKAMIWNRLGEAYRKLGNYEKAFLSFQKADKLEGKSPAVMTSETPQKAEPIETGDIPDAPQLEELADAGDDKDNPLSNFERRFAGKPHSDILAPKVEAEPSVSAFPEQFEYVETPDKDIVKDMESLPEWLSEDHKNTLVGNEKRYLRVPEWLDADRNSEVNSVGMSDQFYSEQDANDEKQGPFFWEETASPLDQASSAKDQKWLEHEQAYKEYLEETDPADGLSDHMDEVKSQAQGNCNAETLKAMETKNAQVWNELGNVYMKSGSYDDAIAAYQKAIELERSFAWPYSNLALAFVQKGFFTESIHLYQRSIELFTSDKDKAITWNRLGKAYRCINDYTNAIIAYQTADELDPENVTLALRSSFGLLGDLKTDVNLGVAS